MAYKYSNKLDRYYLDIPLSGYNYIKKRYPDFYKTLQTMGVVKGERVYFELEWQELSDIIDAMLYEACYPLDKHGEMTEDGIRLENVFADSGLYNDPEEID